MRTLDLGAFGTIHLEDGPSNRVPLPDAEEMRALDAAEIARSSSLELMERAGRACVEEILKSGASLQHVVVLCGPGNNGGDELVVARLLEERGVRVTAVASRHTRYSADFLTQQSKVSQLTWFGDLGASDTAHEKVIREEGLKEILGSSSLIVDALLGTGQSNAPQGTLGEVVRILSEVRALGHSRTVISIDVPTGCSASTGAVYSPHVVAHTTIAIQCIKRGLLQFPARAACGEIRQREIGIPVESGAQFSALCDLGECSLPGRRPDTHKGLCGHVVVVGGSEGMVGASVLAGASALRSGAGLVTRCSKVSWEGGVSVPPEIMTYYPPHQSPSFEVADIDTLLQLVRKAKSVVVGPGTGERPETIKVAEALINDCIGRGISLAVDASALVAIPAVSPAGVRPSPSAFIATPHPGEAARLLGCTSSEVQGDRFQAIKKLHHTYGGTWVLKGAGTLIWNGEEGILVPRGTPYLATAGSGDVLAGLLGTLLCLTPTLKAASLGVLLHAVAGERAARVSGGPIVASDIVARIPELIGEVSAQRFA